MRSDMAKVIVERPRIGGSTKPKGYRKALGRDGLDSSRREGMKRVWGHGTKYFNEHLGPLRRYLASQVGRPWDKVFSEISAHISRDSAVQDHVRDHVMDYVAVNVVTIDGVLCYGGGTRGGSGVGTPLGEMYRTLFYVCPKSGLLKKIKHKVWQPRRKEEPRFVPLDETHQCRFMDGAWYLVTLRRFPEWTWGRSTGSTGGFDVMRDELLKRDLSREDARRLYGAAVCAVSRRLLGKREMRQYPIPIDWQK